MLEFLIKVGLSVLLSAIGKYLSAEQRAILERRIGRLEAERDQSREGERVQSELAAEAAKKISEDEAIERLERGDA